MAKGFLIKRTDDEHVEITLDDKEVASLNHDEDGWNGIERAESLVLLNSSSRHTFAIQCLPEP